MDLIQSILKRSAEDIKAKVLADEADELVEWRRKNSMISAIVDERRNDFANDYKERNGKEVGIGLWYISLKDEF